MGQNPVRDVTIFVSLYLVLSLPPFLLLNRDLSTDVVNFALVATLGTTGLVIVTSLFLVSDGVGRYTHFFFSVTDVFSVVVDLSFALAAVSWWLVPEVAISYDWGAQLRYVLTAIIICHVPMVLFLSVMTIIGEVKKSN